MTRVPVPIHLCFNGPPGRCRVWPRTRCTRALANMTSGSRAHSNPHSGSYRSSRERTHTAIGCFFSAIRQNSPFRFPTSGRSKAEHPEETSARSARYHLPLPATPGLVGRYARSAGGDALPFVGMLSVQADVVQAADAIRDALGLELSVRRSFRRGKTHYANSFNSPTTRGYS